MNAYCVLHILLVSCSIICYCQLKPEGVLGKYFVNNCVRFLNLQHVEHAHLVLQYIEYWCCYQINSGCVYFCSFIFAGA